MTAVTITISDDPQSEGALDISVLYDPPLDPGQPNPATPAQLLAEKFMEWVNPPEISYASKCKCADCGKLYEDHLSADTCGFNLICHVCGDDFAHCDCPGP